MEKNNDIMAGKGEKGEWKTINGAHVFIAEGQSVEDAVNKQFSKSSNSKSSDKESVNQNKTREDKFISPSNSDSINKSTTSSNIENDLSEYKGSGSVDLVLPGGKWAQIRPQNDGTYLVRTNKGQKYVSTVDDAKKEIIGAFNENKSQSQKQSSNDEDLRTKAVNRLLSFGYSKEQSEQAFDAAVDFWQKQLNCDRQTAIKVAANNN